jgi:predicted CXXCH cytochrome family protein
MYESPTMTATVNLIPTGASRLCLSCHDGTIAVGALQGGVIVSPAPPVQGNARLALPDAGGRNDLSGDHPISFTYPFKAELTPPSGIQRPVALSPGNRMECTSCHNPHDNQNGKFLVLSNLDGAQLCTACHLTPGWMTVPYSVHKTAIMQGNQGCGTCHQSHKAPGQQYTLKNGPEENNCLTAACHSSVAAAFTGSIYNHPVINQDNLVHKPNESLPVSQKHVKCVDCHSPHQANKLPLPNPAPLTPRVISSNGPLSGVRGVSRGGVEVAPAQYEYEVCFRCHSGGTAFTFIGQYGPSPLLPSRLVNDPNQVNRFAPMNPSFHPVIEVTRQPASSFSVQSLIDSTANQIIYCSGCHSSHSSTYPHLLRDRYETLSLPENSSSKYALCFRCHKDTFSGSGFPYHDAHVYPTQPGRQPVPCSACHDPHGVSSAMGGTPAHNAHLINFDRNLLPSDPGLPAEVQSYTSLGSGRGSCTVSCHTTGSPSKYTHAY